MELKERALALADATLPRDSLVVAYALFDSLNTIVLSNAAYRALSALAPEAEKQATYKAAWRGDARVLQQSQRCLALLCARWRAGALFTPTPAERAFFTTILMPARMVGGCLYLSCARAALFAWPPALPPAEDEARLHGVHGALLAALELDARFQAERATAPGRDIEAYELEIPVLLKSVIPFALDTRIGCLQRRLRAVCALSQAQDTALRRLAQRMADAQRSPAAAADAKVSFEDGFAAVERRATEDVARHGLRRCTLPACGATEPHPKFFKLCGRCRKTAYCCPAHSKEDWKRHKRHDGCEAAEE